MRQQYRRQSMSAWIFWAAMVMGGTLYGAYRFDWFSVAFVLPATAPQKRSRREKRRRGEAARALADRMDRSKLLKDPSVRKPNRPRPRSKSPSQKIATQGPPAGAAGGSARRRRFTPTPPFRQRSSRPKPCTSRSNPASSGRRSGRQSDGGRSHARDSPNAGRTKARSSRRETSIEVATSCRR